MLGTLVDKLSGFFDKRFVVTYWSPLFVGLGLLAGLLLVLVKPVVIVNWWNNWEKLGVTDQGLLVGGVLLIITLLAFVLEMLAEPILRLYEGYWPTGLKPLTRWLLNRQKQRSRKQIPGQEEFPMRKALLLPTRLGNVLNAANEYSYLVYRLDAFIWWPRLAPLLPENFRSRMDQALSPVQALLNLSIIFTLSAIGGGVTALAERRWLLFVAIFICGLFLARMCYLMAARQAIDYGFWVRVAYDFYRHEILKQMHITVPDNLLEERLLWDGLNPVFSYYMSPWETAMADQTLRLALPFYYDTHQTSTDSTSAQEIRVRVMFLQGDDLAKDGQGPDDEEPWD